MVKEDSDITARAGVMKREGERKSPGEARPEEHGPARPALQSGVSSRGATQCRGVPALRLCFPQGFIPGCSRALLLHVDILPP